MTANEKHRAMAEEIADRLLDKFEGCGCENCNAEIERVAAALAAAEREGMKRAAEIAQAEAKRLERLTTEAEIIASAILAEIGEGK